MDLAKLKKIAEESDLAHAGEPIDAAWPGVGTVMAGAATVLALIARLESLQAVAARAADLLMTDGVPEFDALGAALDKHLKAFPPVAGEDRP